MGEVPTKEERQDAIAEFEQKDRKMTRFGKVLTLTVGISMLPVSVVTFLLLLLPFTDKGLLLLFVAALQAGLAIALLCGTSGARIPLGTLSAGLSLLILYILLNGHIWDGTYNFGFSELTVFLLFLGLFAYLVAAAVVLFVSRSIPEYLYARQSGKPPKDGAKA